ncbi:DNA topoisomerase III [Synergistaceae bacterium OttesenSCG-928-I11]|nr:DNA topoisomerase III [Synergistaceae bacterium OttesenSCG-928-I11]
MKIYLAEKGSVGRALAAALPGETKKQGAFLRCGSDIVAWAAGHLLELFMPEDYDERYRQWCRDTLLYVPEKWRRKEMRTTRNLLEPLKKLIKGLDPKADVVVNVGDADREGQLLIDEILDFYGWKGATKRLRINDVNVPAIRKALENMRDNQDYRGEYMAGQARLYADWLVGLSLTRFVTVSLREAGYDTTVKSVGRVQAPTLGLVVARDREISGFSSKPYWDLRAVLSLDDEKKITGKWVAGDCASFLDSQKRIVDSEAARNLLSKIDRKSGAIVQVEKKTHRAAPPLPYSLSKLQIAASQKYDITDALVHLQKLYEAGYVTYPRTDCDYLPEGHFNEAGGVMDAIRCACPDLGDMITRVDLKKKSPAWNDARVNEHHAVIPTVRVPLSDALSDVERKIYGLLCARYAMQFLPDYEYEETILEFTVSEEKFRATGRTVLDIGWQGWETNEKNAKNEDGNENTGNDAPDEDGDKDAVQILPQVREGECGDVKGSLEEKSTKPPKPYTYHGLIRDMNNVHTYVQDAAIRAKLKEIKGIGTPATQENVIATLFARGYIEKRKKNIYSTELGGNLIDILNGGKAAIIVKPDLTALWEQRMSDIERGAPFEPFIGEVVGMVRGIISKPLAIPKNIPGMQYLEKCMSLDCDGFLRHISKPGRPKFFACPVCRSTFSDVDGKPVKKAESSCETIEAPCPLNCGRNARRFSGKFGVFWKCICSPNTTFKDLDGKPVVKEQLLKAPCPVPGCKGEAARLESRQDKRLFWLCHTCGNFFDDVDYAPAIRSKKARKS